MAESQLPQQEQKAARSVDNAKLLGANVVHAYKHRHSGETSRSTQRRALHSPTDIPDTSPRAIGERLAAKKGWTGEQWTCLNGLWTRESGWNTYATNSASGAYGIPQALPGSKMASAGEDWRSNSKTQIRWGLGYIAAKYGNPCNALYVQRTQGGY